MCENGETRWERWFRIGLAGKLPAGAKEYADYCEIQVRLHEREEARSREKERAFEEAERLRTPTEIIAAYVEKRPRPYVNEWKADDLISEALRHQVDMGNTQVSREDFRRALLVMIVDNKIHVQIDEDGVVRVCPSIRF